MADLIGNEEELNLLRQENQTLRDQANVLQKTIRVQEETIGLLREQIGLKDQLIAALQRETMLLTKQVQAMENRSEKDRYGARCRLLRFDSPGHRRACGKKVARDVADVPVRDYV
jgi:hypothetical protein